MATIRISGLCFMAGMSCLVMAAYANFAAPVQWAANTISMLTLLALAAVSLGTLELKIHRRTRSTQAKSASRLASALRKGMLR